MSQILQINTLIESNDKVRLEVKSLLNPWSETIIHFKRGLDHKLDTIRAYQIRTYLKRHLKGRMRAYKEADSADHSNYESIKNLHHHLNTYYPVGGPAAFFAWIYRRRDTLRRSLPKQVDKSHQKIEWILQFCEQNKT